jgi:hypothetical protein
MNYRLFSKGFPVCVIGGSDLKALRKPFEGIIRCSFWLSILINRTVRLQLVFPRFSRATQLVFEGIIRLGFGLSGDVNH